MLARVGRLSAALVLVAALTAAVMFTTPALGVRSMRGDTAAAARGKMARRLETIPHRPLHRSLAVTTETALELAARLIDPLSFDVLDATLDCAIQASGFWTPPEGHALAAEFTDGAVVLTSGLASLADDVVNDNAGAGANDGTAGDADVSAVVGVDTHDACSLSVTAKAKAKGKITFQYVFASEEYLEFVDQFNDGFLLLYSDATTTKTNVAIVPGTSPAQAVTINNVNNVDNAAYFRQFSSGTEYDGLTTLLPTKPIILAKDQEFTIKLVVADALDSVFDSAVFIKANSVSLFNKCVLSCATGTVPADSCQLDSACEWNDLLEQVCGVITDKEDGAACVISESSVAGQCAAGVCKDVTAPSFSSSSETITVEGNTLHGANGISISCAATDNLDPSPTVAISYVPAGPYTGTASDVYPVGTTTATCTATDAAGNSATKTVTVIVKDTTPPAITVPSPAPVYATGAGTAAVSWPPVTAVDIVVGTVAPSCDHASGDVFPIGTTTVTCTATDGTNPASKAFTVTVNPVPCSPFDGFLPPILPKDFNPLATATSTIPVKWSLSNPAWGQLAPGYPRLVTIACGTDPAPKKSDVGEFLANALATLKLTPDQAVMTFQGKGHVESGKCYRFDLLLAGGCGVTDAQIRSFRIRVK